MKPSRSSRRPLPKQVDPEDRTIGQILTFGAFSCGGNRPQSGRSLRPTGSESYVAQRPMGGGSVTDPVSLTIADYLFAVAAGRSRKMVPPSS
jgi:hypothetical protein